MREKEGFREQYAVLKELFPDRETISLDETCAVLGISRRAASSEIKKGNLRARQVGLKYRIPLMGLARYMC